MESEKLSVCYDSFIGSFAPSVVLYHYFTHFAESKSLELLAGNREFENLLKCSEQAKTGK